MSDVFPKWTNRLPSRVAAGFLLLATTVSAGVWYYFTPKYTRVGYQPIQPVSFSHAVHVEQLGMDCRYCHSAVETSWYANVPDSASCMKCHNQVLAEDPRLAMVRESAQTGRPIQWIRVHRLPDYVFFDHSVHVRRGVSCVHCHGQINQMDEVRHAQPLSMAFCLQCHRDAAVNLRPPAEVYSLNWQPRDAATQRIEGARLAQEWNVKALDHCSACHR